MDILLYASNTLISFLFAYCLFLQQTTGLFGAAKTTATQSLFGTPTATLGGNPTQPGNFGFGNTLKPAGTTNLFGAATATANTLKPGGLFGAPACEFNFVVRFFYVSGYSMNSLLVSRMSHDP